jgi:hypothetical protein
MDQPTLSGLQDERNPLPSWIMNIQSARGKSGTKRILGYRLVIEIAGFAVGSDILAQQRIVLGHGINHTKNFHLESGYTRNR